MSETPQQPTSLAGTSRVALPLHAEAPPLRVWEGGAVRVGNSRVGLDIVVEAFDNGASPEDIVRAYDTLTLADVYAAIAYYLRHPKEVKAYVQWRDEEAEALRLEIEAKQPPASFIVSAS